MYLILFPAVQSYGRGASVEEALRNLITTTSHRRIPRGTQVRVFQGEDPYVDEGWIIGGKEEAPVTEYIDNLVADILTEIIVQAGSVLQGLTAEKRAPSIERLLDDTDSNLSHVIDLIEASYRPE